MEILVKVGAQPSLPLGSKYSLTKAILKVKNKISIAFGLYYKFTFYHNFQKSLKNRPSEIYQKSIF
ncbi:hypothetical protein BPO_1446 [Bergeyella porcorum]|uniref:Uncharacterized protein n=1 Tax=Bergeyella porcorum TaxID=1735111 RepID=A0AAU0F2R5_9FLAO